MKYYQDMVDSKIDIILALNENIAFDIVTVLQFIRIFEHQRIN